MKYPIKQFETLKSILIDLSKVMDLKSVHPCAIHYTAYQQTSTGQTHNWLYKKGETITRAHKLEGNLEGWEKIVKAGEEIELYPSGCNDNHIETATKKAIKEISGVKPKP